MNGYRNTLGTLSPISCGLNSMFSIKKYKKVYMTLICTFYIYEIITTFKKSIYK